MLAFSLYASCRNRSSKRFCNSFYWMTRKKKIERLFVNRCFFLIRKEQRKRNNVTSICSTNVHDDPRNFSIALNLFFWSLQNWFQLIKFCKRCFWVCCLVLNAQTERRAHIAASKISVFMRHDLQSFQVSMQAKLIV